MPAARQIAPVARSIGHGVPDDMPVVEELIDLHEVCRRTTLSASTIRAYKERGQFPVPATFGPHRKLWPAYVIDAWLASRIAARDAMCSRHDVVVIPPWDPELESTVSQHGIHMMRKPAVLSAIAYKKSRLHEMVNEGIFPDSVPIGVHARAWVRSEVDAWREQRLDTRRMDPGFRFLTDRPPA